MEALRQDYPRIEFYKAACQFIDAGRQAQAPEPMLTRIEQLLKSEFRSFMICAPEAMNEAKCRAKERLWSLVLLEVDGDAYSNSEPCPPWFDAMGGVYGGYIWE